MKIIIGLFLGLIIGAGCRWLDIPVPSPPKLVGALLVVAMTLGYMGADMLIVRNFAHRGKATTEHLCGGPTGISAREKGFDVAKNELQDKKEMP